MEAVTQGLSFSATPEMGTATYLSNDRYSSTQVLKYLSIYI